MRPSDPDSSLDALFLLAVSVVLQSAQQSKFNLFEL